MKVILLFDYLNDSLMKKLKEEGFADYKFIESYF